MTGMRGSDLSGRLAAICIVLAIHMTAGLQEFTAPVLKGACCALCGRAAVLCTGGGSDLYGRSSLILILFVSPLL